MSVDLKKYIGITFINKGSDEKGADCFGLIRHFYKNEFDIDIKDPSVSAFSSCEIFNKYIEEISSNWIELPNDELENYCVVGIRNDVRIPKITQHFGIYIKDGNKLLHTLDKIGSHLAPIERYKNKITGFYKFNVR